MTRCFHRPAHFGGPMEAGRCFSPGFSVAFTPPERSRRPRDRPGVVGTRMQMHHSAAGSESAQNAGAKKRRSAICIYVSVPFLVLPGRTAFRGMTSFQRLCDKTPVCDGTRPGATKLCAPGCRGAGQNRAMVPQRKVTWRKRVWLLVLPLIFLCLPVGALLWLRFDTDDPALLRNFNQVR